MSHRSRPDPLRQPLPFARLTRPIAALSLVLGLAACGAPGSGPQATVTKAAPLAADLVAPAPATALPAPAAQAVRRSNAQIARDILELEFRMESGRAVPRLTRFDQPVTLALTGAVPPGAAAEADRLIARLRGEAGIDIARSAGPAAITVEFLPKSQLQKLVPTAACYVVPNVSGLADYRSRRNAPETDWARLERRERIAIFVPSDASPQEVRDCLHEETAQALGPLNDLYRLTDSVFNDDNFHTALTGFDMLALRVHYAPELANGMTEAEVAARLPAILARLNPAGGSGGIAAPDETPRAWVQAIETAFGSRDALATRQRAAERALNIAQAQGWTDSRLAFSWFVLGRLSTGTDPDRAAEAFGTARALYARMPGAAIQTAHADMQLAAFALSRGRSDEALAVANQAIPVARGAQNPALLATLLQIKAEALDQLGQTAEARAVRAESLPLARQGFGSDVAVTARLADIAALAAAGLRG